MTEERFKKIIRRYFVGIQVCAIIAVIILWRLDSIGLDELPLIIFPIFALLISIPAFTYKDFLKNPYVETKTRTEKNIKIIKNEVINFIIILIIIYLLVLSIIMYIIAWRIIEIKMTIQALYAIEGLFGIYIKLTVERFFKKED